MLAEGERRIRAIARVHDVLSREVGEQVSFDEIVPELLRMGEEAARSVGRHVRFEVDGDPGHRRRADGDAARPGRSPSYCRTPVSTRSPTAAPRTVTCGWSSPTAIDRLEVRVADDGVGLAADFSIDETRSLGLSIVRDLVRSQLSGTIEMTTPDRGTTVMEIPLR